eukprot:jgi/Chrzof1/8609/Cz03g17080.t1
MLQQLTCGEDSAFTHFCSPTWKQHVLSAHWFNYNGFDATECCVGVLQPHMISSSSHNPEPLTDLLIEAVRSDSLEPITLEAFKTRVVRVPKASKPSDGNHGFAAVVAHPITNASKKANKKAKAIAYSLAWCAAMVAFGHLPDTLRTSIALPTEEQSRALSTNLTGALRNMQS